MKTYRILSLDGGGICGLLSLVLLDRIGNAVPGWLDKADLLAGTSTGGIIALGIAHGVPLADIRALYEQKGRDIFDDSWLDNLKDLGNVAGAQYGNKALTRELRRIFGGVRLKDLNKRVLIPAFDPASRNATQGKPRQPAYAKGSGGQARTRPYVVTDLSAVALAKAEVLPQLPRPGQ